MRTTLRWLRSCGPAWLALLAFLALDTRVVRGQTVRIGGRTYTQRVWTTEDGLPGNSVTWINQTPDGFLWLATLAGVARFDGVRFDVFDLKNTPAFKSNRFTDIAPDPNGHFWVISEQSDVARYDGTSFIAYDRAHGAPFDKASSILSLADGSYWVLSDAGLLHMRDRTVLERYGPAEGAPPVAGMSAETLAFAPDGTLLVGASDGLYVLPKGAARLSRDSGWGAQPVAHLSPLAGGKGVLVGRWRIALWSGGTTQPVAGTPPANARFAFVDRGGRLWAVAEHAVYAADAGNSDSLDLGGRMETMFEDREGNLWLSPFGKGLIKWTPARVTSITKQDGLAFDDVWSITQDRAGVMWVGATVGFRIRDGRVDPHNIGNVLVMHPDPDGSVWTAGGEVRRFRGDKVTTFPYAAPSNGPRAIFRDHTGRVFVGRTVGVLELRDSLMVDAFGGALQSARDVSLVAEDRSGALYFGGSDGLHIWRDGRFTHLTRANGLSHDQVRSMYEGAKGALWLGTYGGGLTRIKDGQFRRVTTDQGLVEDAVSRIIDDGAGNLWMSGNRGVSRVSEASLDSVADGLLARVSPTLFTVADGMPSNETEGWVQWGGWKASDGTLWFPTVKGLAIIDPRIRHTVPPPVAITDVLLNGTPLAHTPGVRAPPSEGNLEIRYTALSFTAPEKVRFKYRLEPFDAQWTDVGTRRTAYFTKVPPGAYTFHVMAANDDGVWNETGATFGFALEPHWYQRRLVWALAALVLIGVIGMAVRWRIRSLQERLRREQIIGDRLREVDKLKDEFLANTSHELRTPLNGIIGLAQSLTDGVAGPLGERARSDLALIAASGQRLSRLVSDILDFSRARHGDLVLRLTNVDAGSAVRVALTLARPLVGDKPVVLESDIEVGIPRVRADEDRLQQILLNLIGNAIKFTAHGRVTVTVRRARSETGDVVEIGVADTGIGIPVDRHQAIFESFTQGDASTTRRFGGTGLGLTVTRQLVELHGGTIRVESTPGAGARFMVTLPASDVLAPAGAIDVHDGVPDAVAADEHSLTHSGNGTAVATHAGNGRRHDGAPRVLVVDDDPVNTRVLCNFLELEGYQVATASNGADTLAITLADHGAPDLVLLDIMMPGMDGFEVCHRIRTRRPVDALPIIFVTAKSESSDLIAGLDAGANDFLTKPVSRDQVIARVGTHLALARSHRELRAAVEVNRVLGTANDRMRGILDELRTGVITVDSAGTILFASRTVEQILERSSDEMTGQRWDSVVVVDDVDRGPMRALVAAPPSKRESLATRLTSPSGRRYWVEIEVQDSPYQVGDRIIYLNDVSDLYTLPAATDDQTKFHGLIGQSLAMQLVFKEIRDVARSESTVLVEGETGSGKELVARAIHGSSPRRNGPFIALNCAGLTDSILTSQLFGHRRGAFTGAVADQVGLIEAAEGGTLFLDEIGDIPLNVQATLLRSLQEREVVRVGETRPRKVNVRIVVATHRDLAKRAAEGLFREDFLYRIRVARIKLPPLRRRPDDLHLLVASFLVDISTSGARRLEISSEAMEFLLEHAWPGNVRELRGALEHAALKCRGSVIRPSDLPGEILAPSPWTAERAVPTSDEIRQHVVDALAKTGGNRSAAARLLGISRPTLYARLRTLGLIDG